MHLRAPPRQLHCGTHPRAEIVAVRGAKLGLKYAMPKTAGTGTVGLRINDVASGVDCLVDQMNRDFIERGVFHMVVMPGMQIDAINEVEGDPAAMVKELKTVAVNLRVLLLLLLCVTETTVYVCD